jgi:hypothetical protein
MGNDGNGGGAPTGGAPNMGWAMASARRRAMRQTMRPPTIKHGLIKAPHIQHSRDDRGPNFGTGGGFKSGGF